MTLRLCLLTLLAVARLMADPERWEADIAKFEEAAKKDPPPPGALLFVGSSSIRLWDLQASFPDQVTINHGFGGSELEDSVFFADRVVIPHRPSVVFLYAGDNDIQGGKSADRVVRDYHRFVSKIHEALPRTRIVFLPIKPSVARWDKWPEMKKANEAIRAFAETKEHLDVIDLATPMLGADGKPKPGLFVKDGLHLNEAGYRLWTKGVTEWLEATEAAAPAGE